VAAGLDEERAGGIASHSILTRWCARSRASTMSPGPAERCAMPPKTRPSIAKRNREQTRKDRQAEKASKRTERAAERRDKAALAPGEDPDLIGIVAGPQPAEDAPEDRRPDESDPKEG
jgi:hypothetical protein